MPRTKKSVVKDEELVPSESKVQVSAKRCRPGCRWLITVIVLLVIVAVAYSVWSLYGRPLTKRASSAPDQEVATLVAGLRKHMLLPDNEVPRVAEIKDAASAIKEQPFFTGAQNGDFLVIYTGLARAIVYSPTRDLIINVGPIQFNGATEGRDATSSSSTAKTPKKK